MTNASEVGLLDARGQRVAIVAGRFNHAIVESLVSGAETFFRQVGGQVENLDCYWVPGAWELPVVAERLLNQEYDAVVVLGAVIRGATPHFEAVVNPTVAALQNMSVKFQKPVGLGLLTTNTIEEARERAGTKMGNKGVEAMAATIETLSILNTISKRNEI